MVQSVMLRMGHCTGTFPLEARWRNSPEWHICNVCYSSTHILLHFHTFQLILSTFWYGTEKYVTHWHISKVWYIYIHIYIHGTWSRTALGLQTCQHVALLSHQQTQCRLSNKTDIYIYIYELWIKSFFGMGIRITRQNGLARVIPL